MEDPEKGAWTIDETQKLAGSKNKATEKYGCVRQPLFPSYYTSYRICFICFYIFVMF